MKTNLPAQAVEPYTLDLPATGFKVYEIAGTVAPRPVQSRRDYYKMVLVPGDLTIRYGEQTLDARGPFLFLANPHVPHAVAEGTAGGTRFACLFTEAFFSGRPRTDLLHHSPLFRIDGIPIVPLTSEQAAFMTGLFRQMLAVYQGEYVHKNELLSTCLELLLHEALRIQPASPEGPPAKNAALRLTQLFLDLLERQFPIETTAKPLRARSAQDFAERLAVHVNYLNRAVKAVTGKPTSVHIAERVAAEAQALLQYTDWSVADIAYGLGFDYPTYFNNFFKRVTGRNPKAFRTSKA
jgi:AraC family transcriptional activator of pobA